VIAHPLIVSRHATLTPTADGIQVSGRGTGEHDHNHGIAIDVVGLRALAGGSPAIVVSGTITAGYTLVVQGVAGNIQSSAPNGTFSFTIPGNAAVNVPEWADFDYPFVGTNPGENDNYTVTSIVVGGRAIWEVLDIDLTGNGGGNGDQNGGDNGGPNGPDLTGLILTDISDDIGSINGLARPGSPTIHLGSIGGEFVELRITDRGQTHYGLDVIFGDLSGLGTNLTIMVTGRGDETATGQVLLQQPDDPWGIFPGTPQGLANGGNFTMTHAFTENTRISTSQGTTPNLIVTGVYIREGTTVVWSLADAIADADLVPPNGGNENGNGNGEPETVFDLAAWLEELMPGTADFSDVPLATAGQVMATVEDDNGSLAIQIVTSADWQGLDITNAGIAFRAGDTLQIAGRVVEAPTGNQMLLNLEHDDWSPLGGWNPTIVSGGTFSQTFTLTQADVDTIEDADPPTYQD